MHEESGRFRSRARTRKVIELQLNRATDLADLGRVSVHRSPKSANLSAYLLGAEADRIWIFAEGLRAVSISKAQLEITPADLEQRIPTLRGQLPDDAKFYEWDAAEGRLRVTARDGVRHLIDTHTWTSSPAPEPTPSTPAADMNDWSRRMNEISIRNDEALANTLGYQPGDYGLSSIVQGETWFGIFSDGERRSVSSSWSYPGKSNGVNHERRKLWTAPAIATPQSKTRGSVDLGEIRSLAEGRTYLRGGFLRDGARLRPVQEHGSPDLFIEHYSAIDASAQMLLTRISPSAEERWTATLPLKFPRKVCATEHHVAFAGLPPGTDFIHKAQLVSVDLRDGTVRTFAFNSW
jgi:hypothetical protein